MNNIPTHRLLHHPAIVTPLIDLFEWACQFTRTLTESEFIAALIAAGYAVAREGRRRVVIGLGLPVHVNERGRVWRSSP